MKLVAPLPEVQCPSAKPSTRGTPGATGSANDYKSDGKEAWERMATQEVNPWEVQWQRPTGIYSGAELRSYRICSEGPATVTLFVRYSWRGGLPSIQGVPLYASRCIDVDGVEVIVQLPGYQDPRFGGGNPNPGEPTSARGTCQRT